MTNDELETIIEHLTAIFGEGTATVVRVGNDITRRAKRSDIPDAMKDVGPRRRWRIFVETTTGDEMIFQDLYHPWTGFDRAIQECEESIEKSFPMKRKEFGVVKLDLEDPDCHFEHAESTMTVSYEVKGGGLEKDEIGVCLIAGPRFEEAKAEAMAEAATKH